MNSRIDYPDKLAPITILNDDCLRAIFNLIPITDLVALNQCCRSFNQIGNEVINKKFLTTQIEVVRFPSKMLEKFGRIIEWLTVSNYSTGTGIQEMKVVQRLCPNVKKLSIRWLNLEVFSLPFFGDVLEQITELNLKFCNSNQMYDKYIVKTMQRCKDLESLTLNGYGINLDEFLLVKYSKLHRFKISSAFVDANNFAKFCIENQKLKHIDVEFTDYPFDIMGILDFKCLESISLTTHSLEDFVQDAINAVVTRIFVIPSLRVLKMTGSFQKIPSIKHLKQLQAVKFHFMTDAYYNFDDGPKTRFNNFDIKEISELPFLREFTLIHDDQNDNTLEDLIDTVRNSPNLKTLVIPGFKKVVVNKQVVDVNGIHQKVLNACQNSGVTLTFCGGNSNDVWWTFSNESNIVNVIRNML